jgi:L-ribulose-5-phosphate 3-epimerase
LNSNGQARLQAAKSLRVGVRAHDFGRLPADELAARIAAKGFSCVQLALNKAIAGLELQPGELNSARAKQLGGAFQKHGVEIAVLGCYINPLHPDAATRASLFRWFKNHLRFARDFGCGIVALESGSVNANYSPHLDNAGEAAFQALLASLGELVAEAERCGVTVGLEAVTSHVVSTPPKMRRVLDAIPSANLRVVFDPVNLLSRENFLQQPRVLAEALDLFGDKIAVVHSKDFIVEAGGLKTVPAGRGRLDYARLFEWMSQRESPVPILLEEADESVAADCLNFLKRQWEQRSAPLAAKQTVGDAN